MNYALDTNMFTHLALGHARVAARYTGLVRAGGHEFTMPVVARNEVLRGRYDALRTAEDGAALLTAYDRLVRTETALAPFRVLPIDPAAAAHFDRLRAHKKLKRVGRPDLLIACICLAHAATLVTRNTKDFAPIPGLKVENWAD